MGTFPHIYMATLVSQASRHRNIVVHGWLALGLVPLLVVGTRGWRSTIEARPRLLLRHWLRWPQSNGTAPFDNTNPQEP